MFVGRGKDPVPVQLEGEDLQEALDIGDVQQDDEHGLDRIYIQRKMNYGQKQKLMGLASRMQVDPKAAARAQAAQSARANGRGSSSAQVPGMPPPAGAASGGGLQLAEVQTEQASEDELALAGMQGGFDIGSYNIELLVLNVVSWMGPSFVGMAVTRDNILDLDPDNMLVARVVEEIGRRNKKRERISPK
jgi:hypothetical protein